MASSGVGELMQDYCLRSASNTYTVDFMQKGHVKQDYFGALPQVGSTPRLTAKSPHPNTVEADSTSNPTDTEPEAVSAESDDDEPKVSGMARTLALDLASPPNALPPARDPASQAIITKLRRENEAMAAKLAAKGLLELSDCVDTVAVARAAAEDRGGGSPDSDGGEGRTGAASGHSHGIQNSTNPPNPDGLTFRGESESTRDLATLGERPKPHRPGLGARLQAWIKTEASDVECDKMLSALVRRAQGDTKAANDAFKIVMDRSEGAVPRELNVQSESYVVKTIVVQASPELLERAGRDPLLADIVVEAVSLEVEEEAGVSDSGE